MSKTRLLLRLLLVLILVGVGWVCYQTWRRTQPGYYLDQAQAARAAGDLEAAKIQLQNVLAHDSQDVAARVMLADVLLEQAEANGQPSMLAAHPTALQAIEIAAKLEPSNADLQKRLLGAYLAQRDFLRAATAANVVIEAEPNNARALFALAWRDTRNRSAKAEQWLSRLAGLPNPRAFQTLELACDYYEAKKESDKLQNALHTTCQLAARTAAEDFALLTEQDRRLVPALLTMAVSKAPDIATAQDRCGQALAVCQKLAEQPDADLADLATSATAIVAALAAHRPPADDQQATEQQNKLVEQAESLRARAISAGKATLALYWQSAALALAKGDVDSALSAAQQGLAATSGDEPRQPDAPLDKSPEAAADAPQRSERLALHELAGRCLLIKGQLKDATPHIEALLLDDNTAGVGHLFAGVVASAEGRHGKALTHYQQAERGLGQILPVRMGLANAYRGLNRWREALPLFESLKAATPTNDAQQLALASQLKINPQAVDLAILQANLTIDQWEAAEQSLQALRDTPTEPLAVNLAVGYLWAKGQRDEAQRLLAETRTEHPEDVGLLNTQAAMWQRLGQQAQAETLLQQAAEQHSDSLNHQLLLANWYLAWKKSDELAALLARIQQTFPQSTAPQILKAQALLRSGDSEQALNLAAELSKSPETARLGELVAALAQLNLKDLPAAETQLEKVTEEIDNAVLHLLEAEVALAQGKYEKAVSSLADTLDITALRQRTSIDLLRAIVLLAQQEGPGKAAELTEPLLQQFPEDPMLWLIQADILLKQGNHDAGLRALQRMEQLTPNSPIAPYFRAMVLARLRRLKAAQNELDAALKRDPNHLPSLMARAGLDIAASNYERALKTCRGALSKNSQLWPLYLLQARALRGLKRFEEAEALLQQALKRQPRFAAAHVSLATTHNMAGQPDKALEVVQAARQTLPDNHSLALGEIQLLCDAGRLEEAGKTAEHFVGDEPQLATLLLIARAFAGKGQLGLAEQWARRGLAIPTQDDGAAVRGQLHAALGQLLVSKAAQDGKRDLWVEASEHFQAALDANGKDLSSANNLAWVLVTELDQPEAGAQLLNEKFKDVPVRNLPVQVIDTLAEVYRRVGRLDRAREITDAALEVAPGNAVIRFHHGMTLAEQGETALAQVNLQTALDAGLPDDKEAAANAKLAELAETQDGLDQPPVN